MTWVKWTFACLFDCTHLNTTWPQRDRTGLDYVCCLDCGREFPYSIRLMRIVSEEEQLEDRSQSNWAELENIGSARIARSNAKLSIDTLVQ
jgi:hypothetical protein